MFKGRVVHWLRREFFITFIVILFISCNSQRDDNNTVSQEKAPLEGAFPSLEALAQEVLTAIEDSSYEKLMAVRVTESEYRDFLWANLPPGEVNGLPVEKAWSWVERDCRKTARRVLFDYGGQELRLVKVYALREVREYAALKVIRGLRVVVRNEHDEDLELDFMNVILETNNTFKVIAYNS